MSTLKLLLKTLTVLSVLTLLLYAPSQLYNVLDKKWTLLISKQKKLILKFFRQWLSLKNISNLQWAQLTLPHLEKPTLKFQILNGRTSVGLNKSRSNFKKWFFSQLSTQINSWNSVCNHPKEFFSMALQVVVKPFLPRQLLMNAVLTLFQLKVQNYWLCGSVKVKPMSEMFSIRPEPQLPVCFSSISWIQLPFLEVHPWVMPEELVIELLTSYWLKWMVLELKRISSLLVQLTDHKFLTKPYSDQ